MSFTPRNPGPQKQDPKRGATVLIAIIAVVGVAWLLNYNGSSSTTKPIGSSSYVQITAQMVADAMTPQAQAQFCSAYAVVGDAGEPTFARSYGYQADGPTAAEVFAELARRC